MCLPSHFSFVCLISQRGTSAGWFSFPSAFCASFKLHSMSLCALSVSLVRLVGMQGFPPPSLLGRLFMDCGKSFWIEFFMDCGKSFELNLFFFCFFFGNQHPLARRRLQQNATPLVSLWKIAPKRCRMVKLWGRNTATDFRRDSMLWPERKMSLKTRSTCWTTCWRWWRRSETGWGAHRDAVGKSYSCFFNRGWNSWFVLCWDQSSILRTWWLMGVLFELHPIWWPSSCGLTVALTGSISA